jgi:metal-responsive CopG/Arc/MetJ family transcriptional regulator
MMSRINVRLDPTLKAQLESVAQAEGVSPSDVVRAALKAHLDAKKPAENCLEIAQRLGIIGCLKGLPPDLSTNPAYMEGFGE